MSGATFTGNTATASVFDGGVGGGGIDSYGGTLVVTSSTFINNTAPSGGGGGIEASTEACRSAAARSPGTLRRVEQRSRSRLRP